MFVNQIVCPVAVDLYNKSVNADNARCNAKNLIFISNSWRLLTDLEKVVKIDIEKNI